MKYLKKFDNHAAYEAAESSLILPNVSLCVNENEVHYNPYVDPYAGHDYVDLGLPSGTMWATMNVGATAITDTGLYFQWGDTSGYTASEVGSGEGQKYFGWADYKYSNNGGSTSTAMTKYNKTDHLVTLEAMDDAAVANMGGSWRMPTETEFNELLNTGNTTNVWTSITVGDVTVYGRLFTSKSNSNTLFFPAAGDCNNGSVDYVGSNGLYWSSSLDPSYVTIGLYLNFGSGYYYMDDFRRYIGYSVRGVVGQ